MWTRLAPALLIALASCGAARKDKQMNENVTVARFALTSSDIRDGQPIPAVHSCDGANQSPALSWDEPPAGFNGPT